MPIAPEKTLEELFKARLAQLRVDSEYATGAISQHVKAVSYGLVAIIIPFVTSEPEKLPKLLQKNPKLALLCAALGFAAVCADIAQHMCADKCASNERNRIVGNLKAKNLSIDSPSDFMMTNLNTADANARRLFYKLKIALASTGVIFLIIILVSAYVTLPI